MKPLIRSFAILTLGAFIGLASINLIPVWPRCNIQAYLDPWYKGYYAGWHDANRGFNKYYSDYEGELSAPQVIELLKAYRDTHQYYVDHPERVQSLTGSADDNARLVENYSKIIAYVERLAK